ncbi:MAG: TMEM43 family protein [Clostridia bacterium]|nr:TMEM43 family protein [Clostridia bacterium]
MKLSTGKIIYLLVLLVALFLVGKSFIVNGSSKIDELKNATVLNDSTLNGENEGKLVLVTGPFSFVSATDNTTGVTCFSPVLKRSVEMYQYDYDTNTKIVDTVWSKNMGGEVLEDGEGYTLTDNRGIAYQNPRKELEDETFFGEATVGDYNLDKSLLVKMNAKDKVVAKSDDVRAVYNGKELTYENEYFTTCPETGREIVGDIRIKYNEKDVTNVNEVTVLGLVSNGTIMEYTTDKGAVVAACKCGKASLDSIIKEIEQGDKKGKTTGVVILVIIIVIGYFIFKKKDNVVTATPKNESVNNDVKIETSNESNDESNNE